MQDNKITISLTTVIIIGVSIVALILGIVSYAIYNNFNQNEKMENNRMEQSPVNSLASVENNNSYGNTEVMNNNNNSNGTSTDKEETSNSSSTSSIIGKTSSKQNPLDIGEWGIGSKYSSGKYIDIPVKVTNVTRGTTAAQRVKYYCENESSIYKYEDAKEGMEWAVVEYSVDLTNIEEYSMGKSIKVDAKVTGTGDNNSIKYNGYTYIVSTMNMTNDYSKENIATGYFAVQLPSGCTDYLIVLGSSSGTQAFFNGK